MQPRIPPALLLLLALFASCSSGGEKGPALAQVRSEQDLRMAWWREARF